MALSSVLGNKERVAQDRDRGPRRAEEALEISFDQTLFLMVGGTGIEPVTPAV
jgi:hypothetical protein